MKETRLMQYYHPIHRSTPEFWLDAKKLQTGATLESWQDRKGRATLTQSTAANKPIRSHCLINDVPITHFNGVSQYVKDDEPIMTATSGRFMAAVQISGDGVEQVVFSQADEATANQYLQLGVSSGGKVHYKYNNGGTADELVGDTSLGIGWCVLEWASDGDAISMWVDGVAQTITVVGGANSGNWFGDVTDVDNAIVGAIQTSGGVSGYFYGAVGELVGWDGDIPTTQQAQVRGRLARIYTRNTLAPDLWMDAGHGLMVADAAAVSSWKSRTTAATEFVQATGTAQPAFAAAHADCNDLPALTLDGGDYLALASAFSSSTSGTVVIVAKRESTANQWCLLSQNDESGTSRYLRFQSTATADTCNVAQRDNDTRDQQNGSTDTATNLFAVIFSSNGLADGMRMWVNDVAQTLTNDSGSNTGDWFGDVTGADNTVIGALVSSTGPAGRWIGEICEVLLFDTELSDSAIARLNRLLSRKYGI